MPGLDLVIFTSPYSMRGPPSPVYTGDGGPRIEYGDVKITKSRPGTRAYGAAGEKAAAEERKNQGAANG